MRPQTPTACEIQAPLTRRGFLAWVTPVPALKGRPTVKRRDAAAEQAFGCPTSITYRENTCFMVGDLTTPGISIRVVVSADPNVQTLHLWNCRRSCSRPRTRLLDFDDEHDVPGYQGRPSSR